MRNHKHADQMHKRFHSEAGFSLLETVMATLMLAICMAGVTALFSYDIGTSKGQGDIATRTIAYSQDKMEQLLSLDFTDATSDTTVSPITDTGGTGIGGDMVDGSSVGAVPPTAPAAGYVDYLTSDGVRQTTADSKTFYTRQWKISISNKVKTIEVVTKALSASGGKGKAPSMTLVSQLTDTR
jgi:hypothetical protein